MKKTIFQLITCICIGLFAMSFVNEVNEVEEVKTENVSNVYLDTSSDQTEGYPILITAEEAVALGYWTQAQADEAVSNCSGNPPGCAEGEYAACVFNYCPMVSCWGYEWKCFKLQQNN